ncbi:hypothetical protein PIB30_091665 [Stylosanthes scabra]|uniref:Uncharacterized protein n=1 Tax=Stylosanthes scabra TaxID=79078 RepID=A0ABU6XUG4_9FABA|nr:hypothetical protein [Stylosanthes scabra]
MATNERDEVVNTEMQRFTAANFLNFARMMASFKLFKLRLDPTTTFFKIPQAVSIFTQSVLWCDNAYKLWKDLKHRFYESNLFRIAELEDDLFSTKQDVNVFETYHGSANTGGGKGLGPTISEKEEKDVVVKVAEILEEELSSFALIVENKVTCWIIVIESMTSH